MKILTFPKFDISGVAKLAKADSQTKKSAAWIGATCLFIMGVGTAISYRLKNKHEKKKTEYEVCGYKEMREADLNLYKAKKEIDAKLEEEAKKKAEEKAAEKSKTPEKTKGKNEHKEPAKKKKPKAKERG